MSQRLHEIDRWEHGGPWEGYGISSNPVTPLDKSPLSTDTPQVAVTPSFLQPELFPRPEVTIVPPAEESSSALVARQNSESVRQPILLRENVPAHIARAINEGAPSHIARFGNKDETIDE